MITEAQQHHRMTTHPVWKLICRLAVPTVISMLVTSVYNMADTYFVSRLGTSATGAVGVVFSLMAIIQAIGFTLGMGAGNVVSRLLGEKKIDEAQRIGSTAFYVSLVCGALMSVFGVVFVGGVVDLLGASESIRPYAASYARYVLYGAPVMTASFVLNNVLRAQGRAVAALLGIGFGGLLNIGLDPLFIFTFDMGISGAAIATLISQCVSFLILLACFIFGKTTVKLSIFKISKKTREHLLIWRTGFPSLCRQGLASIATIMLNRAAGEYGDAAIAAISVVGRVAMLIGSVMVGFGQGFQPVAGYNYGAKKYDRVVKSFHFTLWFGVALMAVLSLICFFVSKPIIGAFESDDPAVIQIGVYALRANLVVFPVHAIIIVGNMTFQSLGKPLPATILSCLRQGFCFIPLLFILPPWLGLKGVQFAQPVADVLSAIVTLPMTIWFIRKVAKMQGKEVEVSAENFKEMQEESTQMVEDATQTKAD